MLPTDILFNFAPQDSPGAFFRSMGTFMLEALFGSYIYVGSFVGGFVWKLCLEACSQQWQGGLREEMLLLIYTSLLLIYISLETSAELSAPGRNRYAFTEVTVLSQYQDKGV